MPWAPLNNLSSPVQHGSEGGIIVLDDEHDLGARITLERECRNAPFAITCGVYGRMFHTRYFATSEEAHGEFDQMKAALGEILDLIPRVDDPEVDARGRRVTEAIEAFVARFP